MEQVNTVQLHDGEIFGILSNGALIDGKHYKGFVVRGMTGYDEDILSDNKMDELERLNRIIVNCVVGFYPVVKIENPEAAGVVEGDLRGFEDDMDMDGEDRVNVNDLEWSVDGEPIKDKALIEKLVWHMSTVDRLVLLLAIRRASLGDVFTYRVKCPNCGVEFDVNVDLSELAVYESAGEGEMVFESEVNGHKVKWHMLTAVDEAWLKKMEKKIDSNKRMTLGLLARLEEIDGYVVDRRKVTLAMRALRGWTLRERNQLRNLFRKMEGDVETEIEHTCKSCGFEWKEELDIGRREFFFPLDGEISG